LRIREAVVITAALDRVGDATLADQRAADEVGHGPQKGLRAEARDDIVRQRTLRLREIHVPLAAGGADRLIGNPLDQSEAVDLWRHTAAGVRWPGGDGPSRLRMAAIEGCVAARRSVEIS